MSKMKNKEIQKGLLETYNEAQGLEEVLSVIRTKQTEADARHKRRCKRGKRDHLRENCKQRTKMTPSGLCGSGPCGFCAGPRRCAKKDCDARNNRCSKCMLYGHVDACCTKWVRLKGRASSMDNEYGTNVVEPGQEDNEDVAHLHCIPVNLPQQVKQIIWCEVKGQFNQHAPTGGDPGPPSHCLDTGAADLPSGWKRMKNAGLKATSLYRILTGTLRNLGQAPGHETTTAKEVNSGEDEMEEVLNTAA